MESKRRRVRIGVSYKEYKTRDKERREENKDDRACVYCLGSCIEGSTCGSRYMGIQGSWGKRGDDIYVLGCCDRCYYERGEDEIEATIISFNGGGGGTNSRLGFYVDNIWRDND